MQQSSTESQSSDVIRMNTAYNNIFGSRNINKLAGQISHPIKIPNQKLQHLKPIKKSADRDATVIVPSASSRKSAAEASAFSSSFLPPFKWFWKRLVRHRKNSVVPGINASPFRRRKRSTKGILSRILKLANSDEKPHEKQSNESDKESESNKVQISSNYLKLFIDYFLVQIKMVESLDRIKGSDDKGVGSRVSKIVKTFLCYNDNNMFSHKNYKK